MIGLVVFLCVGVAIGLLVIGLLVSDRWNSDIFAGVPGCLPTQFKLSKNQSKKGQFDNFAIIVHTFDGYRRYWPGLFYFWEKHYLQNNHSNSATIYFANEEILLFSKSMYQLHCTLGDAWGDRLRSALQRVNHKYVLYLQEDIWLTEDLDQNWLTKVTDLMTHKKLLGVKLFDKCQHTLGMSEDLNDPLWYVGTHQPSIWDREFLLKTLTENGLSPFQHEVSLNRHLHSSADGSRFKSVTDIGLEVKFKYEDVSRQGQLRSIGKKMLQQEGLHFHVDEDEIMVRNNY